MTFKHPRGTYRRFTDEEIQQLIVGPYLAGAGTVELAEKLGSTPPTIVRHLHGAGIPRRSRGRYSPNTLQARYGPREEQRQDIIDRHRDGQSPRAIAEALSVSEHFAKQVLRAAGVDLAAAAVERSRRRFSPEQSAEILRRYAAGEGTVSLGEAFGATDKIIARAVREAGGVVRPRRGQRAFTAEQEQEIAARYVQGESTSAMAQEFEVDITTVRAALARVGVPMRRGRRSRD